MTTGKSKKNVLIIAPYFPPSAVIGARRPAQLVHVLAQNQWSCHVLTLKEECALIHDNSNDFFKDVRKVLINRTPCRSLWNHADKWEEPKTFFGKVCRFFLKVIAKLSRPFLPVDELSTWISVAIRQGMQIIAKEKIQLIWATAPLLTGHEVARRLSELSGVPYALDFRDVRLPQQGKSVLSTVEGRCLSGACAVSVTSPAQLDLLKLYCPDLIHVPQAVIYNGMKELSPSELKPSEFVEDVILHGGSLYGGERNITGFISGLDLANTLRKEKGEHKIKFVNYGPESDRKYIEKQKKQNKFDYIVLRPLLSSVDFFNICKNSGILVIFVGHDNGRTSHEGAIPGKFYDYLAARRPILVIGPIRSTVSIMVKQLKRGLCVEDSDAQGIANSILFLSDENFVQKEIDLTTEMIRPFSREFLDIQIIDFFEAAASTKCD